MRTVKSPAPLAGGRRAGIVEVQHSDPTPAPAARQTNPVVDDLRLLAAMTVQTARLRGIDREPVAWALAFIARRLREIAQELEVRHG